MSFVNATPINAVAVNTSTANDPVAVSLEGINQAIIYVRNIGDSTNLSVLIESSPDSDGTIKAPLQTFTLNTTTRTGSIPLSVVPAYIFVTATNSDASNATTYSVIISKRV